MTREFADIYIDGVLDTTINTYAPQIAYQQVLYQKNGLLDDRHILKVVCKGIKTPWATNIGIDFDAFEFSGDTLPAPLVNFSDGRPSPLYTWFLFTDHIGVGPGEYTDAVWMYWARDIFNWNPADKAVVIDKINCNWSPNIIGMPIVIKVGNRLAIFYDGREAPGDFGHMYRNIGLAWLNLPLVPPQPNYPTPNIGHTRLTHLVNNNVSITRIVHSNCFTFPEALRGNPVGIKFYDLNGKCIHKATTLKHSVDLQKSSGSPVELIWYNSKC